VAEDEGAHAMIVPLDFGLYRALARAHAAMAVNTETLQDGTFRRSYLFSQALRLAETPNDFTAPVVRREIRKASSQGRKWI
jgi:hypothetical protein